MSPHAKGDLGVNVGEPGNAHASYHGREYWGPEAAGNAMRSIGRGVLPLIFAGTVITAVFAQRAFRQYPSVEYGESIPLPPDWKQPAEWTFARLMFPPGPLDGYRGRFDGPWQEGLSLWTQDYPRADRGFADAVRRLTLVRARSVEQPVSLDDGDEVYNWPWLYAVQVGEWGLTQAEAKKLRDYLLRGGFLWPTTVTEPKSRPILRTP